MLPFDRSFGFSTPSGSLPV